MTFVDGPQTHDAARPGGPGGASYDDRRRHRQRSRGGHAPGPGGAARAPRPAPRLGAAADRGRARAGCLLGQARAGPRCDQPAGRRAAVPPPPSGQRRGPHPGGTCPGGTRRARGRPRRGGLGARARLGAAPDRRPGERPDRAQQVGPQARERTGLLTDRGRPVRAPRAAGRHAGRPRGRPRRAGRPGRRRGATGAPGAHRDPASAELGRSSREPRSPGARARCDSGARCPGSEGNRDLRKCVS